MVQLVLTCIILSAWYDQIHSVITFFSPLFGTVLVPSASHSICLKKEQKKRNKRFKTPEVSRDDVEDDDYVRGIKGSICYLHPCGITTCFHAITLVEDMNGV